MREVIECLVHGNSIGPEANVERNFKAQGNNEILTSLKYIWDSYEPLDQRKVRERERVMRSS